MWWPFRIGSTQRTSYFGLYASFIKIGESNVSSLEVTLATRQVCWEAVPTNGKDIDVRQCRALFFFNIYTLWRIARLPKTLAAFSEVEFTNIFLNDAGVLFLYCASIIQSICEHTRPYLACQRLIAIENAPQGRRSFLLRRLKSANPRLISLSFLLNDARVSVGMNWFQHWFSFNKVH